MNPFQRSETNSFDLPAELDRLLGEVEKAAPRNLREEALAEVLAHLAAFIPDDNHEQNVLTAIDWFFIVARELAALLLTALLVAQARQPAPGARPAPHARPMAKHWRTAAQMDGELRSTFARGAARQREVRETYGRQ